MALSLADILNAFNAAGFTDAATLTARLKHMHISALVERQSQLITKNTNGTALTQAELTELSTIETTLTQL